MTKPYNGIVGFSMISNLDVLHHVKNIYIDGTFKSCQKCFMQFFTVHGIHNDNYATVVEYKF